MIVIFCLDVTCNNETVILLYLYRVLEKMSLEKMPLSEICRKVPHGKKTLGNCPPGNPPLPGKLSRKKFMGTFYL